MTSTETASASTTALPRWMHQTLLAAAVYGVVSGVVTLLAPGALFSLFGLEAPVHAWLVRGVALTVALFGLGYGIAATDPVRHWPIVLLGLLAKLAATLGFLVEAGAGTLPWSFGWLVLVGAVVWLLPFAGILREVGRRRAAVRAWDEDELITALAGVSDRDRHSLLELSFQSPLLVIFLRHFGCTFCRETLSDLAARRPDLAEEGVRPVLVHMSDDARGQVVFGQYGLEDVDRIADPGKALYDAFGLGKGSAAQLFGARVVWRALFDGAVARHGFGGLEGDGFQMPGAFLVRDGRIERSWRASHAGERPDWRALVVDASTPSAAAS